METPVALNIFNRLDTGIAGAGADREARPQRLFVIADGPRPDRPGEAEACAAARGLLQRIDWDCQVITRFSDVNLGNKRCLSEGYDWVFSQVDRVIALEDDCLPDPTFFRFCEELLERYADDSRIMTIGGDNFQFGRKATSDSYYFSRFHHTWGFATWRRAWKLYDRDIKIWPQLRQTSFLLDVLENYWLARDWTKVFDDIYENRFNVWDAQWAFCCWANSTLGIVPAVNLICNIGWGPTATTTKNKGPDAAGAHAADGVSPASSAVHDPEQRGRPGDASPTSWPRSPSPAFTNAFAIAWRCCCRRTCCKKSNRLRGKFLRGPGGARATILRLIWRRRRGPWPAVRC